MKTGICSRESVALLAAEALVGAEAKQVGDHLRQCPTCRDYFFELSELCNTHRRAAAALPVVAMRLNIYRQVAQITRVQLASIWCKLLGEVVSYRLVGAAGVVLLALSWGRLLHHRSSPMERVDARATVIRLPSPELSPIGSKLMTYRLALNHSPEALDLLLSREAAGAVPEVNSFRLGVLRLGSDL